MMSSFVWMKFLESSLQRYDEGIKLFPHGRIADVYERIATYAASPGKPILDLGRGTGGVHTRMANSFTESIA